MLRDMFIAVLQELKGFSLETTTSTLTAAITPNIITRTATITKDDQQNDPDYDPKEDDEDKDKDDRLPLSQEDVNNFMATFLLGINRQFIGHRLHPTATEIRIESLKGFYQRLDNESATVHVKRHVYSCSARTQKIFPLTMTTSTPTAKITPSRTNRTATMMEDDQENDPNYDLKDDNEDDEDEDKDHK
ncbi:hypothetical protein Patl1_14775 [Pistacia atlantica]|uniref:Uncharacterized protein n=1 Tax=Pistacia atlantica TaxID=434234 RepID=A0ACC1AXP5_9ROSI|nr:hypothetical protein Patl1_14775 [Pistacia atlantica]